MLRFDLPITSSRWAGNGMRRRLYGARQRRKLLLLRESVIREVDVYRQERGSIYFNHAIEELILLGLKLYEHSKRRKK